LTKLNNEGSLSQFNLLTVDEATKLLKISKSSVYEMVKDGRMPSVKLPGVRRVFIKRADLENIIS
jgi:excisionase family DNA binding protein